MSLYAWKCETTCMLMLTPTLTRRCLLALQSFWRSTESGTYSTMKEYAFPVRLAVGGIGGVLPIACRSKGDARGINLFCIICDQHAVAKCMCTSHDVPPPPPWAAFCPIFLFTLKYASWLPHVPPFYLYYILHDSSSHPSAHAYGVHGGGPRHAQVRMHRASRSWRNIWTRSRRCWQTRTPALPAPGILARH